MKLAEVTSTLSAIGYSPMSKSVFVDIFALLGRLNREGIDSEDLALEREIFAALSAKVDRLESERDAACKERDDARKDLADLKRPGVSVSFTYERGMGTNDTIRAMEQCISDLFEVIKRGWARAPLS